MRALPPDGAVLERPPARVQYWFSESLEPEFSAVNVRGPDGTIIASGGVSPDNDSLMSARLPSGLPQGTYIVELRLAFASDGHVLTESQVFSVGAAADGIAGIRANSAALPLEVLWRTLLLSSLLLLFGVYTLYALVLLPAWGSPDHPAGLLPPRVMRRLNTVVLWAFVLAFAGSLLALLQQTMVFYGVDAAQAIASGFINTVRTSTRFGDVWNMRMLFLTLAAALHAASLYGRHSQPESVRAFWVANAWLFALILGTLSVASHAAGSPLWPWLAMTNDWLHLLAVGFWVGGLAAFVLVLPPALQPYTGETRRLALLAALRRLSRIATLCVAVVITTGIYASLNWLYSPADVTSTTYGTALLLKVLLVGLLVALGAAHHLALRPRRYQRFGALIARIGDFGLTLRLETASAALVLGAVGLLSATPIPKPAFLNTQVAAPAATVSAADFSVTQTLLPGGPGINTYETLLQRGGQPVESPSVRVQMVRPEADWRGTWHLAESAGDGLYVTTGDEIDAQGLWWTLVDVTQADGSVTRAAFAWSITQDAAVQQTRAPQLQHLLALAAVLAVLLWALYPALMRFLRWLDLRPELVLIAVLATGAVIFFAVIGYNAIRDNQLAAAARLNPPPSIVNTVLPDAQSLARGAALYQQACLGWPQNDDLRFLRRDLPAMRDQAVFAAVRDGWRALPACAAPLSAQQRWDIVNYLRTFERER
ncbi:MAG: CopD family protein [Chloroflexi bacterium]|nr:CopD family protein [Chloroflexota bacterium]